MKQALEFWIFGGDLRQHWLSVKLAEEGHQVHCYGLDPLFLQHKGIISHQSLDDFQQNPHAIAILPLPLTGKEGTLPAPFHPNPILLKDIFPLLHPTQQVFGGQVKESHRQLASSCGIHLQDYFAREELTIANAIPTAEGCIQIAMERLPTTIHEARILVTGYGKVASATAQRCKALGAKVTVAARSYAQLEQARADGFCTDQITQLCGGLCAYQCIINTVPAQILGKAELEDCHPHCLIIDLASGALGCDLYWAEKLQRTVVPAPSLPGKVAPAFAGDAIKRCIYHILTETQRKDGDFS